MVTYMPISVRNFFTAVFKDRKNLVLSCASTYIEGFRFPHIRTDHESTVRFVHGSIIMSADLCVQLGQHKFQKLCQAWNGVHQSLLNVGRPIIINA